MTTWKQPEYERVMEELREQELRKRRKKGERIKKDLMVTKTMTNNPNKLTENEVHQVRQHEQRAWEWRTIEVIIILPPAVQVTSVFRGLERGEEDTGTIQPGQLPSAMRSLGLNPSEQEVIDIPNYITRQARILE